MLRRCSRLLVALLAALALAGPASAASSLIVGVSDDHLKTESSKAADAIADLGLSAARLTADWRPGQVSLANHDVVAIQRALGASPGTRLVVALYADDPDFAPRTPQAREEYCSTALSLLKLFPRVNDVVIWNEPNKSTFWKPQFTAGGSSAAPGEYAALLAHCYRVLHAYRASVNVVHAGLSSTGNDRPDAESNVSHSPGHFIVEEGDALRSGAVGRALAGAPGQLFDTFNHHPYGSTPGEPVWKRHDASSTIALGDWQKLMQALWDGFAGTPQPLPGEHGVTIWYLEIGFQTLIDPGQVTRYVGRENVEAIPALSYGLQGVANGEQAPDQATQFVDAIRLAYCQPYVGAVFNFLLKDERDLSRWQSAPIWVDWTPKGSYDALQRVIREVRTRSVDCSRIPGGPVKPFQPKVGVDLEQVQWPQSRSFSWRNQVWRFRVQTGENATYEATLYRLGQRKTPVLTTSGTLRRLYLSWVRFPDRRLAPGRYSMEVVLQSEEVSSRRTRLGGPAFVVRAKGQKG